MFSSAMATQSTIEKWVHLKKMARVSVSHGMVVRRRVTLRSSFKVVV
jgi:hypothetical protein